MGAPTRDRLAGHSGAHPQHTAIEPSHNYSTHDVRCGVIILPMMSCGVCVCVCGVIILPMMSVCVCVWGNYPAHDEVWGNYIAHDELWGNYIAHDETCGVCVWGNYPAHDELWGNYIAHDECVCVCVG